MGGSEFSCRILDHGCFPNSNQAPKEFATGQDYMGLRPSSVQWSFLGKYENCYKSMFGCSNRPLGGVITVCDGVEWYVEVPPEKMGWGEWGGGGWGGRRGGGVNMMSGWLSLSRNPRKGFDGFCQGVRIQVAIKHEARTHGMRGGILFAPACFFGRI